MTLINLRLSQINPSLDSEVALRSQGDNVSSNVSSFETYANSTFVEDAGYANSVVLSENIQYLNSSNANSAYADSNAFTIGSVVNSRDNLLVYLDGILQHPDQYVVDGHSLTLSNTDPLPKDISVGIRHLQTSNVLISNSSAANSTVAANGTISWDYESKRIYVYDGHTVGGYLSNVATPTAPIAWTFQGSTSGYTSGGAGWPGSPSIQNTIQKYLFTSDSDATDVADLLGAKDRIAGHSSSTHGYTSGGGAGDSDRIEKFDFSTEGTSIDVGNLTLGRTLHTGLSSETYGWSAGGNPTLDTIEKFSFSSDSDATDVGELPVNSWEAAGTMSAEYGYISARRYGPNFDDIHKFNFVGSLTVTDIANLTKSRHAAAGVSSDTYGYNVAGSSSPTTGDPTTYTTIDKFPFASDVDATSVGVINVARTKAAGSSSQTDGYVAGGDYFTGTGLSGDVDSIEKFPFASDTNAVDIANLLAGITRMASQQY